MSRIFNLKFNLVYLLVLTSLSVSSQTGLSIKAEIGYLYYRLNTVEIEPTPGWKGYNLQEQNGFDVNLSNGFNFSEHFYAGIGLGYLNFEGIQGCAIFTDMEYNPFKFRLSPFFNFKFGYSRIWNQYDNGTITTLGEMSAGLSYRVTERFNIYFKSGFLNTQQSLFIPVRFGIRF